MSLLIPHIDNLDPLQNRVSIFAQHRTLNQDGLKDVYTDPFHGRMWSWRVKEGDAVYGRTDDFTAGPLDKLGTGKFLRIPYRRIPIIAVDSYDQLISIAQNSHSLDPSVKGMWRGQNQVYTLASKRTISDNLKLYGSEDVVEPSLFPSALRLNLNTDEYAAILFGLLDVEIERRYSHLRHIYSKQTVDELEEGYAKLRRSYLFRPWAFGVAQHYGLPSTGLDITTDIEVAAFFALHKFETEVNGYTKITRLHSAERPFVFLMGVFDNDLIVDADIAPAGLHTPRAAAQKAHFFATAWGNSPNRAAERIVAAFELRGHSTWVVPDVSNTLFPTIQNDPYAAFFVKAQTEFAWINNKIPLNRIYYR